MENIPSFVATNGPLISIVVPVYNVASYVNRCLESLAVQTYSNIEVIVMDDCSTDGTFELVEQFVKTDVRFKACRMPANSGAGDTRQAGVDLSKGEIIGFVDGDDWVDKDFVSVLYGLMAGTHADIVCCQHYFVHAEGYQTLKTPWAYDDRIVCLSPREAMLKMKYYDCMDESLWNKLYKKSLLQKSKMVTMPFEDGAVIYKYFVKAERIALCCIPLYYYYQRDGSLMHTLYSPHKAYVRYELEILKDRAIAGRERLDDAVAVFHIRMGLKLLREFSLLDRSSELVQDCAGIVRHIRLLGYVSAMKLKVGDAISRWLVCIAPQVYMKANRILVTRFKKRKLKKIMHKYSIQTMDVFQKGW